MGMEMATSKDFSDVTAHTIDLEVESLIKKSEERTLQILRDKRRDLDALAEALMANETVSAEEIRQLIKVD